MKVSILLPTLGKRVDELARLFNSLAEQINQSFELIVVSQANHKVVESLLSKYSYEHTQIKIDQRGLSHARNIGIKYINGDVLILSDDDAWYPQNAIETILTSVNTCEYDVVCYEIYDPLHHCFYKNYAKHTKNVTKNQLLKKSSIEICFNLKKVQKEDIIFNENFGLGATYSSGEENIVLDDLSKLGYKIGFVNEIIVYHPKKDNLKINEDFIETKSAIYKKILGRFAGFVVLNLILIKYFKKIKNINKGKAFYLVIYNFFKK